MSAPLIEVTGLRKTYGDRVVLDDVDLRVEPGDVVCLIGSSGSGKSTLLRCLNLLEEIHDGVITFEGREISDPRVDPLQVRRRMGMVFQAYNLFPHLTVLENCTLAPRHAHGLGRRAARERARELLDRFGLAEHADKHPDRLSGGQQQRAAVVRALCTQPTLLLLDEVTAALDPELVGDVLGIVRDLAAAGTTMVLATHEMAFARDVATQVAFLDGGRILELGPPQQVFAAPREERTRAFLRRVLDPGTKGPGTAIG
ncbi:polar amino acid transport system ATP-binding protein [Nocardioides marinisabuli]|uniref:Polar amino acid transport system ATP-binding protein n=1 Tax=Nocardioides marinisabuli TaxID=419476 RepID=A0A7Y9JPZ3_9ACTN|nr:amino acid ABC transporter ATP-binding protein [Nocardioides marinisabuli]NYD56905.1 polar amino acid transport system ATP-binding protein [Nocardioides marinisabuli]